MENNKNKGNAPVLVNFKQSYRMTSMGEGEIEIDMYGDVVESQPLDWWTGEPTPGNYIIKDSFIEDLDRLKNCRKLTIHIDSFGGDASASLFIHNKLREMADAGVELVAKIDGVAMSAATHIACACATVQIPPTALFMVHPCSAFLCGRYNLSELREQEKVNEAWDTLQVEIYRRKSGLSDTVIKHLVENTTFMTGREAVEKGFCDELIEDETTPIAASADRRSIIANGRVIQLGRGVTLPDFIPTVTTSGADGVINTKQPDNTAGKTEGGNISMATNLTELQRENPELAAQVEADVRSAISAENATAVSAAAESERNRIAAIDEIAHLFDASTVHEAKYGENPCTAKDMTYRAAMAAAKSGNSFMGAVKADHEASGAGKVGAAANDSDVTTETGKTPEKRMAEARGRIQSLLGKKGE